MARSKAPPPFSDRVGSLLASATGRWLVRLFGVAVVLLLSGMVVRQARARVWHLPAYRLGPDAVQYLDLPRALGPLVERSLHDRRWLRFDVSVFDGDAEAKIREVIARHPMVAAVRSVVIRYPDRVLVRVRVREPAAWFRVQDDRGRKGFVLVSTDACVLDPRSYRDYRRRLPVPLPRVHGVSVLPPRRPGQTWQDIDEQVAEGISAARVSARLYRDFNGTLSVKTIDVRRFPAAPELRRDGEVRFRLDSGTWVEWGRTERDLKGVAGEDSYEIKQWRLETELSRRGARHGGKVDVRFRLPGEGRSFRRGL